jgi:hypothetical protein
MAPDQGISYSEQYDRLKGCKDPEVLEQTHPKPSKELQAKVPGASRIWWTDIFTTPKGRTFNAGGLLNAPTSSFPEGAAKVKNVVTCIMRSLIIPLPHIWLLYFAAR